MNNDAEATELYHNWETQQIGVLPKPYSQETLGWILLDWHIAPGVQVYYRYARQQLEFFTHFSVDCPAEELRSLILVPSQRVTWDFYLKEMNEYRSEDSHHLEFYYRFDRSVQHGGTLMADLDGMTTLQQKAHALCMPAFGCRQ